MADENIPGDIIDDDDSASYYPIGNTSFKWNLSMPKYCDQEIFKIDFGGETNSGITFMCDQEPDHLGECTFTIHLGDTKIHFERDNSEIPDDDEDFEEIELIDKVLDDMDDDDDDFELLDEDEDGDD